MKSFNFTVVLFAFLFQTAYAQTQLSIVKKDNTQQVVLLHDSDKLFFQGNSLVVRYENGEETSFSITDIRKIYFESNLSVSKPELKKLTLHLFPNPASDKIVIENIDNPSGLELYSITGRLLLSITYHPNQVLDISSLTRGIYIIRINNQVLKFNKL